MSAEIVILVGSPGVGKTWVSDQLKEMFHVVEHDDFKSKSGYIFELSRVARSGTKKILGNTPFGLQEIIHELESKNLKVRPVFIIEKPDVLTARYEADRGKKIPPGHLTRQNTYKARAKELSAFCGTSDEVLKHLMEK